jgi:hypothetical protein
MPSFFIIIFLCIMVLFHHVMMLHHGLLHAAVAHLVLRERGSGNGDGGNSGQNVGNRRVCKLS